MLAVLLAIAALGAGVPMFALGRAELASRLRSRLARSAAAAPALTARPPAGVEPPAVDPDAWARLVAEVEALPDNEPEAPATLDG